MKFLKKIIWGIFLLLFSLNFSQKSFCSNLADLVSPEDLKKVQTGIILSKLPLAAISDYFHCNDCEKTALVFDSLFHSADLLNFSIKYLNEDTFCYGDIVFSGYDLYKLVSNIYKLSKLMSKFSAQNNSKNFQESKVKEKINSEVESLRKNKQKYYPIIKYLSLVGSTGFDLVLNYDQKKQLYEKMRMGELSVFCKFLHKCFDLKTLDESLVLVGGSFAWLLFMNNYYSKFDQQEKKSKLIKNRKIWVKPLNRRSFIYDFNNNYYRFLDLPESASLDDIRKAYIEAWANAETNNGPDRKKYFKILKKAIETFEDPELKESYDKILKAETNDIADLYNDILKNNVKETKFHVMDDWVSLNDADVKTFDKIKKDNVGQNYKIDDLLANDYYKLLGVKRDANQSTIKNAYDDLGYEVKKRFEDDPTLMAEKIDLLEKAFDVLCDLSHKDLYDKFLETKDTNIKDFLKVADPESIKLMCPWISLTKEDVQYFDDIRSSYFFGSRNYGNSSGARGLSDFECYNILGLGYGESPAKIKKAYKKLALKYHPDRNHGDKVAANKFKEVNEAYQKLIKNNNASQPSNSGAGKSSSGGVGVD